MSRRIATYSTFLKPYRLSPSILRIIICRYNAEVKAFLAGVCAETYDPPRLQVTFRDP